MMLEKARHFQTDPEMAIAKWPSDSLYVQRRSFFGEAKPIYIVSNSYTDCAIFEFDIISRTCKKVANTPVPTAEYYAFGMCVCQGLLYFIGGYLYDEDGYPFDSNSNGVSRKVFCYDPKSKKWNQRAKMLIERYDLGTGVINGKLYAIGGASKLRIPLNSVEMYDPDTNRWCLVAPTNSSHKSMSVATINAKMYLVDNSESSEVYDSTTDQWSYISHLYSLNFGGTVCVVNGLLHAVCYYNSEVSVYDPEMDSWSAVSRIPQDTMRAAVAVQGRIYTIDNHLEIAWFDPETNMVAFVFKPTIALVAFSKKCCA